jgi:hypothetical protein
MEARKKKRKDKKASTEEHESEESEANQSTEKKRKRATKRNKNGEKEKIPEENLNVRQSDTEKVRSFFTRLPNVENVMGKSVRSALDQVVFSRPNRVSITQLAKTEKTYLGTAVEHSVIRTLNLARGTSQDCCIEGVEVDIKFSIREYSWMIPNEAVGHVCLLMSLKNETHFNVGLVHITRGILSKGRGNRDQKRSILAKHRDAIYWLVRAKPLPPHPITLLSSDARVLALDLMEAVDVLRHLLVGSLLDIERDSGNEHFEILHQNVMVLNRHSQEALLVQTCESKRLTFECTQAVIQLFSNIIKDY